MQNKAILALAAGCILGGSCLGAAAQQVYGDVARVISATPIHERVPADRRECRMERDEYSPEASETRRCDEIADVRSRIVAYDVRYEYNGREFRIRMPYEPGPQIAVNVEVRPPMARDAIGPRPPHYRGTF